MAGMIVVMGPVLKVKLSEGTKDGRAWKMATIAIQDGLYPLWMTLGKDCPVPGEGELVAIEAFPQIDRYEGKTRIKWIGIRNADLSSVQALPARAAS